MASIDKDEFGTVWSFVAEEGHRKDCRRMRNPLLPPETCTCGFVKVIKILKDIRAKLREEQS